MNGAGASKSARPSRSPSAGARAGEDAPIGESEAEEGGNPGEGGDMQRDEAVLGRERRVDAGDRGGEDERIDRLRGGAGDQRPAGVAERGARHHRDRHAADRADRALTLWTLKEAYIKARGMGLTLPLQEISFLFEDAETFRFEVDSSVDEDLGRWQFCRINHAGHRIALAVEAAAAGDPEIFEASPPLDPPTHLWLSAIAATAGSAGEVREEAAESPRPRPQVFRPLLGKGRRK